MGLSDEILHDLVDDGLLHRAEVGYLSHYLLDLVVA